MRRLLIPMILMFLAGAVCAQQAPAPLTDKEKLQSSEAFILLQSSQQQMFASPQGQTFQQRQREYFILLRGFQQSKGAANNCTLTIKQDWNCPPPVTPIVAPKEPDVSDPTPAPK